MVNLSDQGLNLRTLKVTNFESLISDVNYNFSMILKLPAYKGLKGDVGDTGIGQDGLRGSIWVTLDSTDIQNIITEYGLSSSGQITLSFVNTQLTTDPVRFQTAFGLTDLVNLDIMILPDLSVIQYEEGSNQYVDTGITFANGTGLTQQDVINIVNQILGGITSNDSVDSIYNAVAKLFADASGGINTQANPDSVIDIDVIGAGGGVTQATYKPIAPKEGKIGTGDSPLFIRGAAGDYHQVIQDTLTNDTHDYAAGLDNTPIMVMLQNDYNSGIMLGHRASTSMRLFSKMYKTSSNTLRITSQNELIASDMSYIDLSLTTATIFGRDFVDINTKSQTGTVRVFSKNISHRLLELDDTTELGNSTTAARLNIRYQEVYFYTNLGANVQFLGLDGNKLYDTGYGIAASVNSNSATDIVTADLLNYVNTVLSNDINNVWSVLNGFIQLIDDENRFKQISSAPTDLNTATTMGLYQITERDDPNDTTPFYQNLPPIEGRVNEARIWAIGNRNGMPIYSTSGLLVVFNFDKDVDGSASESTITQICVMHPPLRTISGLTNPNPSPLIYIRTGKDTGTGFQYTQWSLVFNFENLNFANSALDFQYREDYGQFLLDLEVLFPDTGLAIIPALEPPLTAVIPVVNGGNIDKYGRVQGLNYRDLADDFYTKTQVDNIVQTTLPQGSIVAWTGSSVPSGWVECNLANSNIYSFVPNLTGRFLIHNDPSNSGFQLNDQGGSYVQTLTVNNLPPHNHPVYGIEQGTGNFISTAYGSPQIGTGTNAGNTNNTAFEMNLLKSIRLYTNNVGSAQAFSIVPAYHSVKYICKIW